MTSVYDTPTALNTSPGSPGSSDVTNQEAKKIYTFNETGNIMVATTDLSSQGVQKEVMTVFQEVSVFFAAMTKALSDTKNSLYDMDAVKRIIDGSGMFVQVTQEDVSWSCSQVTATFSQELIESLLGLASGAGELSFASAMIKSIGQGGLKISGGNQQSNSKVGNIVFVCEYILGMPLVSAIVVYADYSSNHTWFEVGPCVSGNSVQQDLVMTKETYLFVVPSAIKQYAQQFVSVENDTTYQGFIQYLVGLLDPSGVPPTLGTIASTGDSVGAPTAALTVGSNYVLSGQNFGQASGGTLGWTGSAPAGFTIVNWSDTGIVFTPSTAQTTPNTIDVYKDADAISKKKPSATTTIRYAANAGSPPPPPPPPLPAPAA